MSNERKMMDSGMGWIGDIPAGWALSKIKNFGGFNTGKDPEEKDTGDIPVFGSSEESFSLTNKAMSDGPAVCIGRKGTIDKPYFIEGPFWAVDTCMYSEVKDTNYKIGYVKYWMHIIPWAEMGTKTALPSLTQSTLNNAVIATPTIKEQQAIATYLDHHVSLIDHERDLIAQKIELLKHKRQALIFECVTGKRTVVERKRLAGLAVGHDAVYAGDLAAVPTSMLDSFGIEGGRLVDSGVEWIGEVPSGWKTSFLKDVAKIQLGKMLTPTQASPSQREVPYLRAANITGSSGEIQSMWATEHDIQANKVLPGDVLVVEGGSIGFTMQVETVQPDLIIQNSVHRIRFPVNQRFGFWWMSFLHGAGIYAAVVNAVSIAHLTKEKLERVPMVSPSSEQQHVIATYLDRQVGLLDRECALLEEKMKLIADKRQALIFEAVTGKIDCRVAV